MSSDDQGFKVDQRSCIRCGACTLLAPRVFVMTDAGARVRRPPRNDGEARNAEAALLTCPAGSIKRREVADLPPPEDGAAEAPEASIYALVADQSERVRWRLGDVAWDRLTPARATAPLRTLVREMAFSEHATYSATQRFMQAFSDDVELTEWLSIWFYEETRHPHVLTAWLRQVGGEPENATDFVLRGRVSTPFMKSKMGTLVTNVVSEVMAASAYRSMASAVDEPVLAQIAGYIAADESRHAASFFRFAQRRLETATDPARERLDAVKVLHFWLSETEQVTHPINQMLERMHGDGSGRDALSALTFDFAAVKRRVTRLIGLLVDRPLRTADDVLGTLKQLTGERHDRPADAAERR